MAPQETRVVVLIVHYNCASELARCLASLEGIPYIEVWVLENGSEAAQAARAAEVSSIWGNVHFEMGKENLGFAGGLNSLFASAQPQDCDIVWALNPDTIVGPRCLEVLSRSLTRFDIVSPVILYENNSEHIWYAGGHIAEFRGSVRHQSLGDRAESLPQDPFPTKFVTGAAPVMLGRTWRLLDGFREDLFLYWEDADFSIRARGLGLSLGVVPEARVWHSVGASSSSAPGKSETYYFYIARNRLVVCARNSRLRLAAVLVLGAFELLRLTVRASRETTEAPIKRRAVLAGTVAGFRAVWGRPSRGVTRGP